MAKTHRPSRAPEGRTITIPGRAAEAIAGAEGAGGRFAPGPGGAAVDVTLRDSFDRQVARSGRLLVETDGALLLFSAQGPVLRQTAGSGPVFVQDLEEGPVRAALAGTVSPLRSLFALGQGRLVETPFALVDDEGKTRARLTAWAIEALDGRAATLVRVEGLRGYGKTFERACAALAGLAGDAAPDVADVAAALFPDAPGRSGKVAPALDPDETAHRTATEIVRTQIAAARSVEAGIVADLDTEFLHDYRVALRRARSVLSLFRGVYGGAETAEMKAAFAGLMAETGRLRDLDVFLLDRAHYIALLPGTLMPGLEAMFGVSAAERDAEQARLAARLESAAYAREIAALERRFSAPEALGRGPAAEVHALDYARRLIWKRYRQVCRIAETIGPETPDEEVHELRIHCKKLRYLMEFFAPLFGSRRLARPVKALRKLQDNLGLFNDYAVQAEGLDRFVDAARTARERVEIAKSVGALTAVLEERKREERARVSDSLRAFGAAETQAAFGSLFHGKGGTA